ncbi:hypothetical protein IKA15_00525 [bacterium]|nr:hypothetical protein [bacterium]
MKKIYSLILTFIITLALGGIASAQTQANLDAVEKNIRSIATNAPVLTAYIEPLAIVNDVDKFLNRPVRIQGKFDKFTTLGLDYPPAMRKSEDFISFMVQRNDVLDHNVPLSELKLFMKRKYAEKFIELDTGDKINITGKVFSNALGDAWVDVDTIEIVEKANKGEVK